MASSGSPINGTIAGLDQWVSWRDVTATVCPSCKGIYKGIDEPSGLSSPGFSSSAGFLLTRFKCRSCRRKAALSDFLDPRVDKVLLDVVDSYLWQDRSALSTLVLNLQKASNFILLLGGLPTIPQSSKPPSTPGGSTKLTRLPMGRWDQLLYDEAQRGIFDVFDFMRRTQWRASAAPKCPKCAGQRIRYGGPTKWAHPQQLEQEPVACMEGCGSWRLKDWISNINGHQACLGNWYHHIRWSSLGLQWVTDAKFARNWPIGHIWTRPVEQHEDWVDILSAIKESISDSLLAKCLHCGLKGAFTDWIGAITGAMGGGSLATALYVSSVQLPCPMCSRHSSLEDVISGDGLDFVRVEQKEILVRFGRPLCNVSLLCMQTGNHHDCNLTVPAGVDSIAMLRCGRFSKPCPCGYDFCCTAPLIDKCEPYDMVNLEAIWTNELDKAYKPWINPPEGIAAAGMDEQTRDTDKHLKKQRDDNLRWFFR